jgi:CRISPR/Cas system-associated exonuclease Cas4 (RecB family)
LNLSFQSLEYEINEKFEQLLEQKFNLDLENKNLIAKIDVLKEEMRIQLMTCEEQLSEVRFYVTKMMKLYFYQEFNSNSL